MEGVEDDGDEFEISAIPDSKNPKCHDRWFYIVSETTKLHYCV
jgi:hypothetical protein